MPNGSDEAERRLVLLAISGDDAAFAALVRLHQRYIGGLLTRASGDPTLAEDLTQAAFLQAWRRIAMLRTPEAFKAWLRRIALNLLIDATRGKAASQFQFEEQAPEEAVATPEAQAMRRMDAEAALSSLTIAQRTCIILAHGEGMTHAEIAATLEMPPGTVKSHITRGLAALRQRIDWSES